MLTVRHLKQDQALPPSPPLSLIFGSDHGAEWRLYRGSWWVKPTRGDAFERWLYGTGRVVPGVCPGGRRWWRVPKDFISLGGKFDLTTIYSPTSLNPLLKRPLRPYQAVAVSFAYRHGRVLIADGMRLGKTAEALATAYTHDDIDRWIAIVPASKLWDWAEETTVVIPSPRGDNPQILRGRTPHLLNQAWLYILNYEIVDAWADGLSRSGSFGVILDECVYIKGRKSKRFNATVRLCDRASAVIGLSGEPIENRPSDLWGQLRCIRGRQDFGTFAQFHARYCAGSINEWGGYDYTKISNPEELKERLYAFTIRRTKFDPEVMASSPRTTRQAVIVEAKSGQIGNPSVVAATETTIEAVRGGESVLIFTYYRNTAAVAAASVRSAIKAQKLSVPVEVITGEDPAHDRDRAIRSLRATAGPRILIGTIRTVGMGLDLSDFDVVCFVELDFVPTRILQAEERLYSVSRTRPIGIYYFAVKGSRDQEVAAMLVEKLGQIDRIMGPDRAGSELGGVLTSVGGPRTGSKGGQPKELTDLVARLRAIEEKRK